MLFVLEEPQKWGTHERWWFPTLEAGRSWQWGKQSGKVGRLHQRISHMLLHGRQRTCLYLLLLHRLLFPWQTWYVMGTCSAIDWPCSGTVWQQNRTGFLCPRYMSFHVLVTECRQTLAVPSQLYCRNRNALLCECFIMYFTYSKPVYTSLLSEEQLSMSYLHSVYQKQCTVLTHAHNKSLHNLSIWSNNARTYHLQAHPN